MTSSREQLRAAFARIAMSVAVVTVADDVGVHGCTTTTFAELLDPPVVLVPLRWTSATRERIHACGRFAVNLLAAEQEPVARRFAGAGDRFAGTSHQRGPLGQPLLDGVVAAIECRLTDTAPFGAQELLIGTAEHATTARAPAPLLFGDGRFLESPPEGRIA